MQITIIKIEGKPVRGDIDKIAKGLFRELDPECARIQRYELFNLVLPGLWPDGQIKKIVKEAVNGRLTVEITHPNLGDPKVPRDIFETYLDVDQAVQNALLLADYIRPRYHSKIPRA